MTVNLEALGPIGCKMVFRQHTFSAVTGVRHVVGAELIQSVDCAHRAQKLLAGVAPVGVIGRHEKLGGSKIETRPENVSLADGAFSQSQKFALPVTTSAACTTGS